ncbi:EamA family transporter [uncultured Robinsoniella sp.]|uniref:EamA family transporter n=1 Tax=uncultured Robinsoniella sp. TaxID=904190 RepID=UPI00374E9875
MWVLFAFGSALFAGITAVLAKLGIEKTNSYLVTALRTVIVVLFAWLMVLVAGSFESIAEISGKTFLFLILSGLATGASWICYFKALQMGDVNKVVSIDKSSTILTMLFAFLFLKEGLSIIKVLAMALMGTGTYLMLGRQHQKPNASDRKPEKNGAWLIYALLSAVFASLTAILGKVGIAGVESNLGTAIRTLVVLIMAWLMVFGLRKQKEIKNIERRSWIFILLSGLTTGLSWLCYYRALQDGPAGVVVPIDKLSILVTVFFSYFVLKEKLKKKAVLGLIFIVVGTLALLI